MTSAIEICSFQSQLEQAALQLASSMLRIPPVSGIVCSDLLALLLLELNRAEVVQFLVFSERVVEMLDVIEDIGSGLLPGSAELASATLRSHGREEAFHSRAIPTFTAPAHAARDVVTLEQRLEFVAQPGVARIS